MLNSQALASVAISNNPYDVLSTESDETMANTAPAPTPPRHSSASSFPALKRKRYSAPSSGHQPMRDRTSLDKTPAHKPRSSTNPSANASPTSSPPGFAYGAGFSSFNVKDIVLKICSFFQFSPLVNQLITSCIVPIIEKFVSSLISQFRPNSNIRRNIRYLQWNCRSIVPKKRNSYF